MSILISIILAALFVIYFVKYRKLTADITDISKGIADSEAHPARPITRISSEKSVQTLLNEINPFIDRYRELNKKSRRLDQGIKNTVTNLSHDLKTPLTVISGYAEVTRENIDTIDPQEMQGNLAKIEQQSKKLVQVINGYFDLNKLNAGELKMVPVAVDVCEVLREEILSYHLEIEQSAAELVLEVPEAELLILGDVSALRRIFSNLLSNAIRYGMAGNYLAVKAWSSEGKAYIEISDRGKGILEENQTQIFERLTTLEDATDKNYSGSGLGLAITKKLVESLDGKISLYSKPFVRTSFTLEFPLYTH